MLLPMHNCIISETVIFDSYEIINKVYMKPFQKLTLPSDFAQRILDNEIQFKLAEQPSSEVICNLIELYSKGVEYYQSIKSYKYLYFKKKMTELFSDNAKAFASPPQDKAEEEVESPIKLKLKSKNDQERIQALKIRQQQSKLEQELNQKTRTNNTKKEVEKIIKNNQAKEKSLEDTIRNNLEKQDKALEEKLRQRKKRSFCKSFSAYGLTESTQTKESLFAQELTLTGSPPTGKPSEKGIIDPLVVSFQNVIKDDSDDEKELIIMKAKSIIPKGRMASMGRLAE